MLSQPTSLVLETLALLHRASPGAPELGNHTMESVESGGCLSLSEGNGELEGVTNEKSNLQHQEDCPLS